MNGWGELKDLCLAPPRLTLAAAESLTCGRVQALIGGISGASTFFQGGVTAYTLEQKVRHLGVTRAAAAAVNCVSEQVVREMAQGACRLFRADLAVATTGYAEAPPPEAGDVPFAWWAVAHRPSSRWTVRTGRIVCPGANRGQVQAIVAEAAVAELLAYLRAWRGRG